MKRARPIMGNYIGVTSKASGMTSVEVEQKFIDWFPEYLSRPDNVLVAKFKKITVSIMKFHILVEGTKETIIPIPITQLQMMEYSSGMLIFHMLRGNSIEVDLV